MNQNPICSGCGEYDYECSCKSARFLYTFHRADGFYPLERDRYELAKADALRNPGTLKVVNETTGVIVWKTPSDPSGNENQLVALGSPKSASGLISYNKGSAG